MEEFPVNVTEFLKRLHRVVYSQFMADWFGLTHSLTSAGEVTVSKEEENAYIDLRLPDPAISHCLGIVTVLAVALAVLLVTAGIVKLVSKCSEKVSPVPSRFLFGCTFRFLIFTFLWGIHVCFTYFLIPSEYKDSRGEHFFVVVLTIAYLAFVPAASLLIYVKRTQLAETNSATLVNLKSLVLELRQDLQFDLQHTMIFCARRLMLVAFTLALRNHAHGQAQFFLLFQAMYFCLYLPDRQPHAQQFHWKQEIWNEFALMVGCVHLMCFTTWFKDPYI